MDNLPRSAGQGPPLEATDAVLAGIFQGPTDNDSMMPLPVELLQFVGMHDPKLADSLYHLKLAGSTSTQGLVGENVRQFMSNWTPNSAANSSTLPRPPLTHWHPSAPTTEYPAADTSLGTNATTSATGAGAGAFPPPIPSMSTVPMLPLPRGHGHDNTSSTLSIQNIVMAPIDPEAANMSANTPAHIASGTPRFAAGPASPASPDSPNNMAGNTQYHYSGQTSSAAAGPSASSAASRQGARSFHAVIGGGNTYDAASSVPRTVVQAMPAEAGFVTGPGMPISNDDEWSPAGNMRGDQHSSQPIVLPSISRFFHDMPFPSVAAPAPPPPPPEHKPDITWDWATVPSSFEDEIKQEDEKSTVQVKSEPETEVDAAASAEASASASIDADVKAEPGATSSINADAEPSSITLVKDILANGIYPEWNKIGISFQLIVAHFNHGHIESAAKGFIELFDYIIYNSNILGIIPQTRYYVTDAASPALIHNGTEVALRDLRNFWSQFCYVVRFAFTEQLLRTKAVRAILVKEEERRKRDLVAAGELVEDDKDNKDDKEDKENDAFQASSHLKPTMGPDMWWSFGQSLDENWKTYFKHYFKDKTLPSYLLPWFSRSEASFCKYSDAELKELLEAKAKQLAELAAEAERIREAELAARRDRDANMQDADADEKENTAPNQRPASLISYEMVRRMNGRLEALHDILYPGNDKPSQGESDNILPQIFFSKLMSLSHDCIDYHPWKSPNVPVVDVALRRLSDDHRFTHMDPLEFYGHTL